MIHPDSGSIVLLAVPLNMLRDAAGRAIKFACRYVTITEAAGPALEMLADGG